MEIKFFVWVFCLSVWLAKHLPSAIPKPTWFFVLGMLSSYLVYIDREDTHLIMEILLPVFLFSEALATDILELKHVLSQLVVFCSLGVVLSVSLLIFLVGCLLPEVSPFALASILVATDNSFGYHALHEIGATTITGVLQSGESILAEGMIFICFEMSQSKSWNYMYLLSSFFRIVLVSISLGFVFGIIFLHLMSKSRNSGDQFCLTLFCAFLSYTVSEHFHLSGPLTTCIAALTIKWRLFTGLNDRSAFQAVWLSLCHVCDSAILFACGGQFIRIWASYRTDTFLNVLVAFELWGSALLIRILIILALRGFLNNLGPHISVKEAIAWGLSGLKGKASVVLAITTFTGIEQHGKSSETILFYVLAVVAWSYCIEAPFMPCFLRVFSELKSESVFKAEIFLASLLLGKDSQVDPDWVEVLEALRLSFLAIFESKVWDSALNAKSKSILLDSVVFCLESKALSGHKYLDSVLQKAQKVDLCLWIAYIYYFESSLVDIRNLMAVKNRYQCDRIMDCLLKLEQEARTSITFARTSVVTESDYSTSEFLQFIKQNESDKLRKKVLFKLSRYWERDSRPDE
jgi:NhaP-type Na+/H+ or K+/H+ antiporter